MAQAAPALADVKAGVDAWQVGDYNKAVTEWRPLALQGDADAQFNMGQAYKLGRGVPTDLNAAIEWYRKAAEQGHLQAQDNYGLVLFQNNRRAEAMPYIEASAARGEPRAQYVLGTAHFNGDIVAKDWVKAYALMTRASAAGLAQASQSLSQMDSFIPYEERQKGVLLAAQLEKDAVRNRQMAAMAPTQAMPPPATSQPIRSSTAPKALASADLPPSTVARSAAPEAMPEAPSAPVTAFPRPGQESTFPSSSSTGDIDNGLAGAAYANTSTPPEQPQPKPAKPMNGAPAAAAPLPTAQSAAPPSSSLPTPPSSPAPHQVSVASSGSVSYDIPGYTPSVPARGNTSAVTPSIASAPPAAAKPRQAPPAAATGDWRIQLGAFSTRPRAEALWNGLEGKYSQLSSIQPYLVESGSIIKLQAGPYANKAAAEAVCSALSNSGQACYPVKP